MVYALDDTRVREFHDFNFSIFHILSNFLISAAQLLPSAPLESGQENKFMTPIRALTRLEKLASFIPIAQNGTTPGGLGFQSGHLASFIPTAKTTETKENSDPASEAFTLREAAKAWAAAQNAQRPQPIRVAPQPGRNEPCPCNSGQKFKRCCLNKAA